jgi:hypothetical protein
VVPSAATNTEAVPQTVSPTVWGVSVPSPFRPALQSARGSVPSSGQTQPKSASL